MEVLLLLVLVGVLIVFYFLPSIIGYNKRNASAIFLLNLFLGWTLVGWVVALVWSVTYDPPQQPITIQHNQKQTATVADQITKLAALRDSGAITEEEFQREKQKVLRS